MPDYFVRSLRFDQVGGGLLFRLPFSLINALRHFEFFKIAERMPFDLARAALAFCQTVETDLCFSGDQDDHVAYDLAMGEVIGYPAERCSPVRWQKTNDGPALTVFVRAVGVQWLPRTTWKTIYDV